MTVTERFLRYVSYPTTSSETSGTTPSTPAQRVLADAIAAELREIGLADAAVDANGYVYASLPASPGREADRAVGFIAHMDTSPAVSGEDIHPRIVRFDGSDIDLGHGETLSMARFPELAGVIGDDLIVTDGSTLLGADDKAGVAEIVTACAYLIAHPEVSHRAVALAFTPDEEIGEGADHFDIPRFAAPVAYTVDGGPLGELEYENFNAASAKFTIHGVNIHPGTAKGKMKNAALIAAELISMLPPRETPAHTEGYEGFYHLCDMAGDETTAKVSLIIRDHDRDKFAARKAVVQRIEGALNETYGAGTVALAMRDSYYNMKEKLADHMDLIENARAAMAKVGVEARTTPIRGGTDGARLSWMGLPCPNLSTGGGNFHGVHEYVSVQSMEKMVEILVELAK